MFAFLRYFPKTQKDYVHTGIHNLTDITVRILLRNFHLKYKTVTILTNVQQIPDKDGHSIQTFKHSVNQWAQMEAEW